MENCIYYQIKQHQGPQSKERNPTRQQQSTRFTEIPYCDHPSGELSSKYVLSLFGSANILTCMGNESKCQLRCKNS